MQELAVYYLAARYQTKEAAGKAYAPLQDIVKTKECELSVYRFFIPWENEKKWYVTVVGEKPSDVLHQRIETILTSLTRGEKATLPEEFVLTLLARHFEMTQDTEYREEHYHAGDMFN